MIYLAAWWVLERNFGNHGLWAALSVFFIARGVTYAMRMPALARAAFALITSIQRKGIKMLDEFKNFAFKGNAFDLAVGVIIGGAFGKIVGSIVDDLIMPMIGALSGGLDFNNYFFGLSFDCDGANA